MTNIQRDEPAAAEANPVPAAPVEALRPSIFLLTALMVLVADQASKSWIVRSMALGESRSIIGQAFRLTLTRNTGGAWGLLPQGNGIFTAFAALAILALVLAYLRVGRMDVRVGAAFSLALGGAVGNLIDRIRLGYVVDFFDARIIHWPVFNMADSAISVSIILLAWHFLRSPANSPEPRLQPADAATAPTDSNA